MKPQLLKKTLNPRWTDFVLINCKTSESLTIYVFDHDVVGKDEFEGCVTISIREHYIKQIQQNTNNLVITYPLGGDPKYPNQAFGGSITFKTFFEKNKTK